MSLPARSNHIPVVEHYSRGTLEVIKAIQGTQTPEEFRAYCAGNVIKYVSRYHLKGGDKDLEKAQDYLRWMRESLAGQPVTTAKDQPVLHQAVPGDVYESLDGTRYEILGLEGDVAKYVSSGPAEGWIILDAIGYKVATGAWKPVEPRDNLTLGMVLEDELGKLTRVISLDRRFVTTRGATGTLSMGRSTLTQAIHDGRYKVSEKLLAPGDHVTGIITTPGYSEGDVVSTDSRGVYMRVGPYNEHFPWKEVKEKFTRESSPWQVVL